MVSGTIFQDIRHTDHCPYPFKKAGVYGNVTKTKQVNERRTRGKGRRYLCGAWEMCFWALITIRTDRMIQGGEAAGEVL